MTTDEFKDKVLCLSEKLYRIAFVILQDKDLTMDAIQEVYAKLWGIRDKLSSVKSIEAFAVTVTKNTCIDMIRSRKITVDLTGIEMGEPARETVIDDRQSLKMIRTILENIPEKQRQVFYLRHFDDCSISQISEIVKLSQDNVRTILSRIRTLLKNKLMHCNGQ